MVLTCFPRGQCNGRLCVWFAILRLSILGLSLLRLLAFVICVRRLRIRLTNKISGSPPRSARSIGKVEKERWANNLALAKRGLLDEMDPDILFRYYRTIKEIRKDNMVRPPDIEGDGTLRVGKWFVGPAGSGKSRSARSRFPDAYMKMANKWWDGYNGEASVIIDDLDTKHEVLAHHIKIWSDRYAFLAENKGGALYARPTTIVVTSQYDISEIFTDPKAAAAVSRRFEVTRFGNGINLGIESF